MHPAIEEVESSMEYPELCAGAKGMVLRVN